MYFKSLGAGLLIGIGFIIPAAWWCSFLGVALFIEAASKAPSLRSAAFAGGATGILWYGLVLAPTFWGVLPLDWFGIDSIAMQILAVISSWALATFISAIELAMLGAILFRIAAKGSAGPWGSLLYVPALWVLMEWVSAFLISVIGYGPGARINGDFFFGATGYLVANDIVLLQIARIGGIYGLSFLVASGGTLIYIALRARRLLDRIVAASCIAAITCIVLILQLSGFPKPAEAAGMHPLTVAVMSRYVPPRLRPTQSQAESDFEDAYQSVKGLQGIDVLVFPEDTAFLRATADGSHDEAIRSLDQIGTGSSSPLVIDSDDLLRADGSLVSRVSFWHGPRDVRYGYKQMFMVFGEYVPYLYRGILTIAGGSQLLDTVTAVRGYMPGPAGGIGIAEGARIAVRFCDEAFSPELYRSQVADGANVLVDISSQSWFHESRMIYSQMQNVAKVRAAESERPFVQSGNMSPAFVLDEHGRVEGETEWGRPEVLQAQILPESGETAYVIVGEKILMLPVLVIGILIIRMQRRAKRQKQASQSK
jgi:apolipoprotein N-acyltransferase